MPIDLKNLLDAMPELSAQLQELREILLANAVMFGEIPSPTYGEGGRVRFMQDRLIEAGCLNVSTDEVGNAVGIHPGQSSSASHILLVSHLDTPFSNSVDHTVKVHTNDMEGPGILDNSLGLAAIASLPSILEKLGIKLQSNLVLMGSSRSLGRGDIEGIRFFLERNLLPIRAGIVVEGGTLGRLSYSSLGMHRGVVTVNLPHNYDFSRFGATGAIPVLNRIVTQILGIPIPREPATSIILGSLDGGTTYNTVAELAQLRFEIRSEQVGMVGEISDQIDEICDEVGASTGMEITHEQVARRHNGGIAYGHPMVKTARGILESLDIKARPAPTTGELAALIEKEIPGITLGLTKGNRRHQFDEQVEIEPMFTGLAQLIVMLQAIDGGLCDVED
ncbi:peptidase [Rubellicoccus peritrichatus]|uniref:Peptidase n=1 Tax=Rubellicoccus peritrichatus TaxID=3080537 RepID=A0AAQ3L8E0_9BACT|nr:peptidase [Puniceicoccus sp. CR14]WOO40766.1 peptidase [Puniceicoccus sp. CR14]